ncbi:unnamed protein product, partial [Mesorhabditis spiculigera]
MTRVYGNDDIAVLIQFSGISNSPHLIPVILIVLLYLGIALICAHVHCFVYRLKAIEAVYIDVPFENIWSQLAILHGLIVIPLLAVLFDVLRFSSIEQDVLGALPLPLPIVSLVALAGLLGFYLLLTMLVLYKLTRALADPKMIDHKFFSHHRRAIIELLLMFFYPVLLATALTNFHHVYPIFALSTLQCWVFIYSALLSLSVPFIHK